MDGGIHSPSPVASVNGQVGNVELTGNDVLPSQTGNSGKVLGTNGSSVSWVDGGAGSGAVDSVNGATGTVVLTQDDVGDGATYKQYSSTEKSKLAGIASGAEVNVNADWNAISGDAQILNKPTLGTAAATDSSAYATAAQGAIADSALQSVVAGTNISVDNTDPQNPVVSATISSAVDSVNGQTGTVVLGADDIDDTATTNKFVTAADLTKLSNTSGTNTGDQDISGKEDKSNKATDFSTINNTLYPTVQAVNTAINNATTGLLDYRGTHNASGNTYPSSGGSGLLGAILKGDFWVCSVAGTLGGTAVAPGDLIIALVDTPGTTSSNWNLIEHDLGYTPENVANKDTDGTLAANSDTKYASQKATKTYADTKVPSTRTVNGYALSSNVTLAKSDVGLGNVDNTSDANKPVSTATQTALNLKANLSILTTETVNQNTTLQAFGDSITAGTGASASANRYINKFATYKGWTLTNNGVSGARLGDPGIIDAIYALTVVDTTNSSLMCGVNNIHLDNTDVQYLETFREELGAAAAWLAIPDSYKQKAINRTSETGTWTTNASTIYGGMGKKSTTNGSTMTFIAKGSTIYVGYIKTNSGVGAFKVTIDGVDKTTVSTVGSVDVRNDGAGTNYYAAALLRIPNLTNVSHTVVITVTSATSSSNTVFIDWVSGNGLFKKPTGPNVWIGNVTMGSDASYVTYGGSNTAVGQYNGTIASVVTDLARDGLRVNMVDAMSAVSLSTDMDADGIHPNDTGHDNLAQAFIAASSSVVNPHDRGGASLVNGPWLDATMQTGWSAFDTGGTGKWGGLRYMKDALGFTVLRGLVKNTSGGNNTGSTNATIAQLPRGYRPMEKIRVSTVQQDVFCELDITDTGNISLITGTTIANNSFISLNGIRFPAEW